MELKLEGRIPEETASKLSAAGHLVRRLPDFDGVMGHAHAIAISKDGLLIGGSDSRCDGSAIGW
ncbi:putative gamma-glutamyltransferase YwrD [compost metagenome]